MPEISAQDLEFQEASKISALQPYESEHVRKVLDIDGNLDSSAWEEYEKSNPNIKLLPLLPS